MKQIVFVCKDNATRSQMAEAFAKIHGLAKVKPYSAGLVPCSVLNPTTIQVMKSLGYDLTSHHPKRLQDLAPMEFDIAITMGCGEFDLEVKTKRRENWAIPDPQNMPIDVFQIVRWLIETKVKELIRTL